MLLLLHTVASKDIMLHIKLHSYSNDIPVMQHQGTPSSRSINRPFSILSHMLPWHQVPMASSFQGIKFPWQYIQQCNKCYKQQSNMNLWSYGAVHHRFSQNFSSYPAIMHHIWENEDIWESEELYEVNRIITTLRCWKSSVFALFYIFIII